MKSRAVLYESGWQQSHMDGADQFLLLYQKALLLSLVEGGVMNEAQYRYAEKKLLSGSSEAACPGGQEGTEKK